MKRTTTLTMLALTACAAWTTDALACSYTLDLEPPTSAPYGYYPEWGGVDDWPANAFFVIAEGAEDTLFRGPDGAPIEFVVDEELDAIWGLGSSYEKSALVARPAAPLTEGARYTLECTVDTETSCGFTVGPEDLVAPERAVIEDLTVELVDDGHDGSGFSCPDLDTLTFRLSGSDDRARDSDLIALAYFADDAEGVDAQTTPEVVFAPHHRGASPDDDPRVVSAALGVSIERQRDGVGFRAEEYCFAIALMDRAGNIGPRSQTECISTIDRSAPYASIRQGGGCSTSGSRAPASPLAALALLGLVGALRRRADR